MSNKIPTSKLIRYALAAALVLMSILLLWALLSLSQTVFSLVDFLDAAPAWVRWLYLAGLVAVVGGSLWLLWLLFRPGPKSADGAPAAEPLDETELLKRIADAGDQGVDVQRARRELALLKRRREAGRIYVGFFGEISTGKSSLIRALIPEAELEVNVRGGTTREVQEYQWSSPSGDTLVLSDMPGTNEVGVGLDDMSRDEAMRSHVVAYVCDGDLSRSQFDDLHALIELGKPSILALNKTDRYRPEELEMLLARLRERVGEQARVAVVGVQAGGQREVTLQKSDGTEDVVVRDMPPRVDDLLGALQGMLDENPEVLAVLRDSSVFVLAQKRLEEAESAHRMERAQQIADSYSRKAMVGAMAAVAPGSDLVIQGYLAVSMVKELSNLYDVPVRRMDTDLLVDLVQKKVARTTTIVMAIAGNAMKAFPGVGTLVGGLTHAVAYGMIFHALGRAVAQSLESRGALRPAQAAQVFEEQLSDNLETSATRFARIALDLRKELKAERRREE